MQSAPTETADTTGTPSPRSHPVVARGFGVFEDVLNSAMLEQLRQVTEDLLATQSAEQLHKVRYQGSNLAIAYQHPLFARLISWPKSLAALRSVGFMGVKWWSAYMLSKPPHAPALYWHQDWWAWDDPCSAWEIPPQLFLMYYLTDTRPENGCLRVIPGTHRKRIPFHDQLVAAHTEAAYEARPDSPLFSRHPDEVDVRVKAGDLVVGDARILHSAHANQSEARRTCLTLWYFPEYEALPDSIKAEVARKRPLQPPDWWESDVGKPVEPLVPWYSGQARPATWNRVPGIHLKG